LIFSKRTFLAHCLSAVFPLFLFVSILQAQGTLADYQRAHDLRVKVRDLVVNTPGAITWIGDSDHFWYPKTVKGGTEFVLVDADAGVKSRPSIRIAWPQPSPHLPATSTPA